MPQRNLAGQLIKQESNNSIVLTPIEELERKIYSITEHQRGYMKDIFRRMAHINPANAAILCDYPFSRQIEVNIKERQRKAQ
jgi:hypothetical protein